MSDDYGRDYSAGLHERGAENVTNRDAYAAGQGARQAGDASQERIDGKQSSEPSWIPMHTGSVGAGAGGGIIFFPFVAPLAALWLYPMVLAGVLGTEFVLDRLRYAGGADPEMGMPAWQGIAMLVVGFLCFRVDDRLGRTRPYYFVRHCYRLLLPVLGLALVMVRQATGTEWPTASEYSSYLLGTPAPPIILLVFAYAVHRFLRSDYMRRTWDYLTKFWRIRSKSSAVMYLAGHASFLPFPTPWRRSRR